MSLLFCSLSCVKVAIFIRPLEGSIYIFITTLDIIGERMSMLLIIMHTQKHLLLLLLFLFLLLFLLL